MNGEIDFFISENAENLTNCNFSSELSQTGLPHISPNSSYFMEYEILNY